LLVACLDIHVTATYGRTGPCAEEYAGSFCQRVLDPGKDEVDGPSTGPPDRFAELIGESPGIAAVRERVARLLERQSDARQLPPILIRGETGTGKGLLARAVHGAGSRAAGPFVNVNCAAIPETLLEAELFGFERGAFTDARQGKAGLFQTAHRGTIFLDEVGLLPEALQGKLLKVLEDRSVRRLGSRRSEVIDVWIVAATSADLETAARARRFREDLYYRLAVLTVWLPPLRERGQDILLLAHHFLTRACADYELAPKSLADDARAALLAHRWPGNIRELANVIERVVLLSDTSIVTAAMLGLQKQEATPQEDPELRPLKDAGQSTEQEHLLEALGETRGNISRAAARLGISRNTIRYRMEKYGLRSETFVRVSQGTPGPDVPASARPNTEAPAGPEPPVARWERRRLTLLRMVLVTVPEEPLADTSRVLEEIVEKVRSFGGRVEELSPTGIVAAFGLEPIEDSPLRATLSAMAMLKAAERARWGDGWQLAGKIGIHAGPFLVGQVRGAAQISLEGKRDAWRVLDTLTESAEPGVILVSEAVVPFLERRFDVIPDRVLERSPGRAYRLAGRERRGLGPGGRMSAFVGRHRELELLQNLFVSALRGQGQVAAIGGEAGIGKSRLLFEFRRSLTGEAITYLEGHCLSYGSVVPYSAVLDVVRMSCGVVEGDSPESVSQKVSAHLTELRMVPADAARYLLHLLGLKEGTDRLAGLGPEVIKVRTFEILRQMCLRRSQRSPVVIVVEDLHWIDTASSECFASLVDAAVGARVLLVVTHRPAYVPSWIGKSYVTKIALQPLAPEESLNIVRSVLRTDAITESLAERIVAKADGNPFFLEELAWSVRDQGAAASTLPVPETIEEVLLARIDRLAPEERRILESASVIGKDFPFRILAAIAEMPKDQVQRSLLRLQSAEFLFETSADPELEYSFKHALTHEVAYRSLLPEQRRVLHGRIVDVIERLQPDSPGESTARLAHHAFRGEEWEKAVNYLRQAGAHAASGSAHREAVAYLEHALEALEHLPSSRDTLERAIDLRLHLRTSLSPLGEFGRIFDYLRQAGDLANAVGDRGRLGRVLAYSTDYFREIGDYDRAVDSGRQALTIADSCGDPALRVATNIYFGQIYHNVGQYRKGIDFLRVNAESLAGELAYERFGLPYVASVHSRTWLVWCLAELGEFAEATTRAEEALRIAEAGDHPSSLTSASANSGLGRVFIRKGELDRAIPALERGLKLTSAANLRLWFAHFVGELGYAYALSGRTSEAFPLLEQALEQWGSIRGRAGQSVRVSSLSEACLLAGRMDDAVKFAEQALGLARDHHERGNESYALCLLGEISSHGDAADIEKAESLYHQAVRLSEALEMRPLLARCHLGLGRLHRGRESRSDAREHLAIAAALFSSMDMPSFLERAELEMKGLH
jgi:DNA-binding NtrC family response regulator/tetratricopeptide (TPR) repeat protein